MFSICRSQHRSGISETDGISIYTMHGILQNKNKWRKISDFSNQNSIWQALCYNHFLDFFADLLLCLFLLSLLSVCKKICKINFLFNCHAFHQILLLRNHYFIYYILFIMNKRLPSENFWGEPFVYTSFSVIMNAGGNP